MCLRIGLQWLSRCLHSGLGCEHTGPRKDTAAHATQCWYSSGRKKLDEISAEFSGLCAELSEQSTKLTEQSTELSEAEEKAATQDTRRYPCFRRR